MSAAAAWTQSNKLILMSAVACASLLMFAGMSMSDGPARTFAPKEGEIVAIRSRHTGKYFEVSPEDGRLRATANSTSNNTARFRVMLLSSAVVEILVDSMIPANTAAWSKRRHFAGSNASTGCKCSGYANDHGFGAYCYGWEYESQTPWCYVADSCESTGDMGMGELRGSFGRKYADCLPLEDESVAPYRYPDGYPDGSDPRSEPGFQEPDLDSQIWDDDRGVDYENISAAWDQSWDETANFTGVDEYWGGTWANEGEEDAWWMHQYQDEGEGNYPWEDSWEDGNYTGCK